MTEKPAPAVVLVPSTLLAGERVLMTLEKTPLVLTNYRVKFDTQGIGSSLYQSIPLDSISFCGFVTDSQPWTLAVALGLISLGAATLSLPHHIKDAWVVASVLILIGLAFSIIYFATRSAVVLIRANCGEQIMIPSHHRKRERVIPFIEAILEARLRFNRKIVPSGSQV